MCLIYIFWGDSFWSSVVCVDLRTFHFFGGQYYLPVTYRPDEVTCLISCALSFSQGPLLHLLQWLQSHADTHFFLGHRWLWRHLCWSKQTPKAGLLGTLWLARGSFSYSPFNVCWVCFWCLGFMCSKTLSFWKRSKWILRVYPSPSPLSFSLFSDNLQRHQEMGPLISSKINCFQTIRD